MTTPPTLPDPIDALVGIAARLQTSAAGLATRFHGWVTKLSQVNVEWPSDSDIADTQQVIALLQERVDRAKALLEQVVQKRKEGKRG